MSDSVTSDEFFQSKEQLELRALKWERLHDARTKQLNEAIAAREVLRAEAARLKALNESLAERVAAQSDLLSRKAEKNGN